MDKCEEKMFAKIEEVVYLINRKYIKAFSITMEENTIPHTSVIRRYFKVFWIIKCCIYDLHNNRFKERNSYSKTDVDTTFMHMKDCHVKNV